nr:MAG TPA: hypothetical protein [Bacteriophage sp.]
MAVVSHTTPNVGGTPLTSSRALHCQSSSRALPRQNRHCQPRPRSGHYAHTPKNAAT